MQAFHPTDRKPVAHVSSRAYYLFIDQSQGASIAPVEDKRYKDGIPLNYPLDSCVALPVSQTNIMQVSNEAGEMH